MKLLFNTLLIGLMIFSTSFNTIDDKIVKEFILGSWSSSENSLQSIDFMHDDIVRLVTKTEENNIAYHYKYRISSVNKENKLFTIEIYQKNLFSDKSEFSKSFNFLYKNSQNVVLILDSGKTVKFKRVKQ